MAYVIGPLVLAGLLVGTAAAVLIAIARLEEILPLRSDAKRGESERARTAQRVPARTRPAIRPLARSRTRYAHGLQPRRRSL